jgi:hypothetical protein
MSRAPSVNLRSVAAGNRKPLISVSSLILASDAVADLQTGQIARVASAGMIGRYRRDGTAGLAAR